MSKFTKGKWKICNEHGEAIPKREVGDGIFDIRSESGYHVCRVYNCYSSAKGESTNPRTNKANARLIAKSPEMYDTLLSEVNALDNIISFLKDSNPKMFIEVVADRKRYIQSVLASIDGGE